MFLAAFHTRIGKRLKINTAFLNNGCVHSLCGTLEIFNLQALLI